MQAQIPVTANAFTQRFSSTRKGARLARLLALRQLDAWGISYGSAVSDSAALIVAEFAANAVTHGRVPGRDFELHLDLTEGRLRIEVSDTRADRMPHAPAASDAESGRGLLLVSALADRWGTATRPGIGKTVWAELEWGLEGTGNRDVQPSSS